MKNCLLNALLFACLVLTNSIQTKANNLHNNANAEACMDCLTAPILICPSTFFGCPGDSTDPSNTGYPTALPGDMNCPSPIVTYTDTIVTNTPCMQVIHRTWLAEYPPGSASIKLHSQCQQTLVLQDLEAPVIENCPSDITIDLANNCAGIATWNLPTATDDCGVQYFLTSHYSGSSFPLGTTTVTYTAQDFCGQIDTCSFKVIVTGSCCSSFTFTCPTDVSQCIGTDTSPATTGTAIATPNDASCPQPVVSYSDSTIVSGPCNGALTIERTWTAIDTSNSSIADTCVQTIVLSDTQNPVITNIPPDITVNGSGAGCVVAASWTPPTVSDNCGIASFESNYPNGAFFNEGSTLVTYTAIDNCGNTATGSFLVTVACQVDCTTNPNLICPSPFTSCPDVNSPPPSLSGYAVAFPGGIGCAQPSLGYTDNVISSGPCIGARIIDRVWTAVDPTNPSLTTSCSQTITLEDNSLPSIGNMPSNITITGTGPGCFAQAIWSEPVAMDNCGISSFMSNFPNGTYFPEGSTPITYTATDNCGNTSTASFLVTVQCQVLCDTPPSITCPSNYVSCPSVALPDPSVSGYAIGHAGSLDCTQPFISFSDHVVSSGPCTGAQIVDRIWTATDPTNSALTTSCIQSISLVDNEAPTITNVPYDVTVSGFGNNCSVPVNWTEPVYNDNCGITNWSSNIPNGSTLSEGISTIIYTAEDNCGNTTTASFNITVNCIVTCNTNPIILGPPNYWACPTGSIPLPSESGIATATAGSTDCDPPVVSYSDVILFTGPCPGTKIIERTWTATDPYDSNLTATYIQIISLEDIHVPSFVYCPSDIAVNTSSTSCSTPVSWTSPVASDNCSSPLLSATDQYGNSIYNGSVFNQGLTTVTYTATDDCGNTAQCSFNVTVVCAPSCNTPPSISCPSNKVVCPGSSTSASILGWATAYAGSNCPTPSVNYQDIITSTGPCSGQKVINRTWTASYPSGSTLTSSCVQIINVKDEHAPTFHNCPSDIIVSDNSTPVHWTAPTATDFCSTPYVTSTHLPGAYFPVGTTQVTYTAVDNCGNSRLCQFNVTVLYDNSATITCPDDLYLTCDSNGGAIANWNVPIYEGSCGNCNGNSIPGFVYMGTFAGHQYYCSTSPATWTDAQQNCANNGGYLATINNASENAFLANILTLQSAWIGLNDSQYEGTYQWANGEAVTYTNWYPGQPNNYNNNQDYVEMLNSGHWNDQYNHYVLEYIMEIPCTYIQQTSGPAPGTFLTGGSYSVSYLLTDACGAHSTCSFNIFVDGGLTLDCPADISVSAPANSNGVTVDWQAPVAQTCCGNCSNGAGAPIQGFVYMGAHNGHHYYCSTQPSEWHSAKATCEDNGGYLAVINNFDENTFLANLLTTQSAWIGLSDFHSEGNFEWVNGDPLNYTNWYPGQPNNYNNNQDYVELLNTGEWNDQYNSYSLEYIMELPSCLNVTQTSGPTSGSVLAPGSTHTVTYLATDGCGNSSTCSFEINVESIPINNTYCDSEGKTSLNYYIDSVVMGTLNNPSGDDGGYGDYTYKCYDVDQNQDYALQLDPGYAGQPDDKVYWKVWIDYNMDGDFEDADEYVAYGCGTSTLTGTISMPQVLWAGETRMRIIMKPGSYATGPCDVYQFGETEDYCLRIWGTGSFDSADNIDSRSRTENQPVLLTGINNNVNIEVYPNPAVDHFNVNIDNPKLISKIDIHNVQGQLIIRLNEQDIENQNIINTTHLNSGMYIMSVQKTDGSLISKKIMIQK